jgi:4-hydroxy-tetrahydrodipicolinate reductase
MDNYKIKFHHGQKFSSQPDALYCLRLSFSWYTGKDYALFVDRFKQMLDDYSIKIKPRVHILGHSGKLGTLIVDELFKSPTLIYSGGLGREINVDIIDSKFNNIIIDVSSPDATCRLITKLMEKNICIPLVIGTTGNLPMEQIKAYSNASPVFVCSNFSMGISQFKKILNVIDKTLWKASIIEKHHVNKKDSPSGTAKTLRELYNADGEFLKLEDVMSVREGEIVGEHELILEGVGETLKISHIANSRGLFASGCVKLIDRIGSKKFANGLYNYDSWME